MTKPEHLGAEHSAALTGILARFPALQAVRRHVAAFAVMMRELGGERLDSWMHVVEADDLPALHTLVTGLRRDHAAVTAGLSLPCSSGAVEGQVNRIKALNAPCTAVPTSTSANVSSSHTESRSRPADPVLPVATGVRPDIKSLSVDS